jgi:hypothetical protein
VQLQSGVVQISLMCGLLDMSVSRGSPHECGASHQGRYVDSACHLVARLVHLWIHASGRVLGYWTLGTRFGNRVFGERYSGIWKVSPRQGRKALIWCLECGKGGV